MSFLDKYLSEITPSSLQGIQLKKDVLSFYAAGKRDRNNNPICLLDHDYGLRGTLAGSYRGTPMGGYPVEQPATELSDEVHKDDDFDDKDADCVEIIRSYSVLEEHSYSIANLFTSSNVSVAGEDGYNVDDEYRIEAVLEDVFADIIGSCFSDASIILDEFPSFDRIPSITIDDDVEVAPSSSSIPSIIIDDDVKVAPSCSNIPTIIIDDDDKVAPSSCTIHSITIDDGIEVAPSCSNIPSIDDVKLSISEFPSLDRVSSITIHDGLKHSLSSDVIPSVKNDDVKASLSAQLAPSYDSISSITIEDGYFEPNYSATANSRNPNLPTFLSAVLEEVLKDASLPETNPSQTTLPETNSTQTTLPDTNSTQATLPDNVANDDEAESEDEMLSAIHECKICDSKFDLRSDLLKHYRGHERDKKSMTCSFCSTTFHSTVELLIHRKQHEKCGGVSKDVSVAATGVSRRRRSSSSNSFSEDAIPPKAKNTVYRCLHCSKPFFNFSQLGAHQENHFADKDQLYKCPICAESFLSLDMLILHGNGHEEGVEEALEFPIATTDSSSQTSSSKTSSAAATKAVTKSTSSRQQRKRMLCIYCNDSFSDAEQLAAHRRVHQKSRKKLGCSFCSQVFEDPQEFSHHHLAHIKERKSYFTKVEHGVGATETRSSEAHQLASDFRNVNANEFPESIDAFDRGPNRAAMNQSVKASEDVVVKIEPPDEFSFVNTDINYLPQYQEQDWLANIVAEATAQFASSPTTSNNGATSISTSVTKDVVAPKQKDFVCPDCDVGFDTLSRLAVHARRSHQYVCLDCKRSFKWLDELNDHRQVYFMKPCYRWSKCPKLAFSHQKQ